MKSIFYLLPIALVLVSCEKEASISNTNPQTSLSDEDYENIHPEMRSYFIDFQNEAIKRGLDFKTELNLLNTTFADIANAGVAGQCSWHSSQPNLVTIDTPFWNTASKTLREWVMYHELGHCILNRGHNESTNQNGLCISIMASGTGSCQSVYNATNKEYYLDELFSEIN